jgi:hypothetical protein
MRMRKKVTVNKVFYFPHSRHFVEIKQYHGLDALLIFIINYGYRNCNLGRINSPEYLPGETPCGWLHLHDEHSAS